VPKGAILEDIQLDRAMRQQIINLIISNLNDAYVYPLVAQRMADNLRQHESKGDYSAITDGDMFASVLTTHLVEVSHDKHLGVFYQPYKFDGVPAPPSFDQWNKDRQAMARDCGIRKIEILANNVGYLKMDFFADPMVCGRTAAAAVSFLANTDAVIFDLRENSGGDPRMVALVSSYLFDRQVHLNNFYDRIGNRTTEYWTPRIVPGIRLGQKPAYVLMSGHTFSGAEEFAYDLRNLKRVTLVGETSGGGAHAVNGHPAGDHFVVWVPNARSINPVTGTDWEGVGVAPDVRVSADDALTTAERLAAEKIQLNAAGQAKPPEATGSAAAGSDATSAKAN
jgi:Peptidase family S41/N-terminal domain of Peptidase_S41 in eukaryotic IRBP